MKSTTRLLATDPVATMDAPGGASRPLVRGVVIGCAVIVVLGVFATIFAGLRLPALPGFNWAYVTLYLVTGVVTAVLLMGSAPGTWSWPIALLASGYVYSALMTVPFLLSFPGAFTEDPIPLLGGSQSAVWTFYLWHAGFLAFVLASTLAAMTLRLRRAASTDAGRLGTAPHWSTPVLLGAVPAALLAAVVLAMGWALPDLIGVGLTSQKTLTLHILSWSVVAFGLFTLGVVIWESRFGSQLHVWLVPVVLLATFEALQLPVSGRYRMGWYAPRVLGMVATTVLLVALLRQVWRQAQALIRARAQSDRLAKIVEQSPLGFALLDNDGVLMDVNQALCDLTDRQREDLIGAPSDTVFGIDEKFADIASLMTGVARSLTLRRRVPRRDGSMVWVDLTVHRMSDADGAAAGMAVSLSDASGDVAVDLDPNAPVGMALVNEDGLITRSTQALSTLVARDRSALLGMHYLSLVDERDRELAQRAASTMKRGEAEVSGAELRLLRHDGLPFYAAVYGSAVRDARGRLVGAALQVIDIDARRRAEAEALEARLFLEHRSTFDELTGLLNRPTFVDRVQGLLDTGSTLAVVNLDLDRFQRVSNSMTRREGDDVLVEVVQRLLSIAGDDTVVARVGGDEFAMAVPVPVESAAEHGRQWASRVGHVIGDHPLGPAGHELHLTCSIGVAIAQPRDTAADRLQEADLAARDAKASGPGQYRLYDQRMRLALLERLAMIERIRAAVDAQEFTAWYQPVVSLEDGRLLGFEALSRWIKPDGTMVPPVEYLPAAEESGLVLAVGAFTLEAAAAHLSHLPEPLIMAVNASPTELLASDFAGRVSRALAEHALDPQRLVVEITEQALFDVGRADDAGLNRLAELGVALYVDDFGTGYSSITHLRDFPISGIKLDRSFTAQLNGNGNRASEIALTLADLAHRLGLDSVAEGVETQAQADRLAAMGWNAAQGWLYGRPQPAMTNVAPAAGFPA